MKRGERMKYYKKRKTDGTYDGYWGVVKDPDGNERDMSSIKEGVRYRKNVSQEIDFINNLPGGRILDVGCGCGHFLNALGKQWTAKVGVEPSKVDYFWPFALLFKYELHHCELPGDFFDAVILYHVIEHVEDPVDLIKEVRRVLKPNGHLLLGTPNFGCWVARRFGKNFRLLHDKTHISLFTKDSMVYFLEDHGFIIDDIKYPFFKTEYFTLKNLLRLFDTSKVSPPFYGNIMTFYCRKGGG